MTGSFDLDGNPRMLFGLSSATVDMGAYEYNAFVFEVVRIAQAAGGTDITWNSRPGDTYTVWSRTDLVSGAWGEPATVPSQGATTSWTDANPLPFMKFYRVELSS